MVERMKVLGASGTAYVYRHLPDDAVPPFQGANLIVAERRRSRWRPLHVGETEYLPRAQWRSVLEQIRQAAPRAKLFYRLNISHAVRQTEVEDIRLSSLAAGADLHAEPPEAGERMNPSRGGCSEAASARSPKQPDSPA
jgi:hypothetical protein